MDFKILSASPLFQGISTQDLENILSSVPYAIRKFKNGSLISQSGEKVNSMNLILTGMVKTEMVDYGGRIIKIEDIHAPGTIAPAFIFGNKAIYPVNVIAVSDTELLVIFKSEFLKLLKNNDIILENFLNMISNRSQFLSEKIKFLNFKTIKSKLAQYILKLAGEKKYELKLDLTQNELADYFGVARPSVARALGELEGKGIIETHGKFIKILSREDLVELIND